MKMSGMASSSMGKSSGWNSVCPSIQRHLPPTSSTARATAASMSSSSETLTKGAFTLRSENCEVLETPSCFHENILKRIRSSRERISLASLYFGTGQKEREIVEEIRRACKRNPELRVKILLDHSRGTRKSPSDGTSSMSMLTSLCNEFPGQFSLSLFLMPQLWSESASRIPARWNEIVAVMHVKAYVVLFLLCVGD